jgi:undecaprenyl-diphosphatase
MVEDVPQPPSQTFASRVKAWDIKWYRRINGLPSKAANFLKYYTHVASSWTWGTIMVGMYLVAWLGHVPFAWAFVKYAVANISSIFIIVAIKLKINRIRPCFVLENVTVRTAPSHYRGPSFPSGHVQFFLSNMLVLTTIASQETQPGIWCWMLPLVLVMTALIAISRVYVGVHYPTDVIGGFFSGAIIYLLTVFLTFPLWSVAFNWIDVLIH